MKQLLLNNLSVEITKDSAINILSHKINSGGREDKDDAFFVGDLGDVVRKYKQWMSKMPRVTPFYAVKCNDDSAVLAVLAQLGTGFDCASKAEIQKVMDLKVSPDRIIYANPCKQSSHIRYAAKHHVQMMTFDNATELLKIKSAHPDAKLVIRIAPPDGTKAQCQLGMKFGCDLKAVPKLLKMAMELELSVIGVSFHVGSGCYDSTAYLAAVCAARTVFDMGEKQGFHFNLLDIGGGFPGQKTAKITFDEICSVLGPALDMYFPESMGVNIISEPGRYFVASAFILAVNIIAKRAVARDPQFADDRELTADDDPSFMYYVNDGVYGSFNCLMYDHATVEPNLFEDHSGSTTFESSIWGPTCDGLDCIIKAVELPELQQGDWFYFKDMGAYTMAAASNFNGMPKPRCYYIMQEPAWQQLLALKNDTELVRILPAMKTGHDLSETDHMDILSELSVIEN